jgi:signal transduction histidine kinase
LHGASALDLLGAAVLCALAVVSITSSKVGHRQPAGILPSLTVILAVLPVAWRRRAPVGCAIAFVVGVGMSGLATHSGVRCGSVYPAGMLIAYSIGLRCERNVALQGLGVALAGQLLESITDGQVDISVFPFIAVLTVGIWGAGRVVRSRIQVADVLAARTRALERQREETARLAVDVEKLRVASDLDLTARERVAEIVRLADAGESAAGVDPDATREAFAGIERSGRESLNEMRALLGVLRSDEHDDLAPRPTLAQVDALLARARAGGHVAEFIVDGKPRPLPEEVEVSAYSILQQLLAESLAAGNGGPVTVRLLYASDSVFVEVTGDACDDADQRESLVAIRERAAVHGGAFTVETPAAGRRLLRAQLPAAVAHA